MDGFERRRRHSSRQGLVRVCHVDTHTLCLQQAARTGCIDARRVSVLRTLRAPSPITTFVGERDTVRKLYGYPFQERRSQRALKLRLADTSNVHMFEASISNMKLDADAIKGAEGHDCNLKRLLPHISLTEGWLHLSISPPPKSHTGGIWKFSSRSKVRARTWLA